MHFWFANLKGVRAELFPSLPPAYTACCGGDRGVALAHALAAGRPHWQRWCEQVLTLHAVHGDAAQAHIEMALGAPELRL